ncbi:MAG TPA: tyrosine-type recombinase/integrase, partial [Bdellovibrionota bacterium]|nr:tyrosine-type recombinase/integrase [Bdellovibrionota bacterium]
MDLGTAIQAFLDTRRLTASASPLTVESYGRDLRDFASTAGGEARSIGELGPSDLERFLAYLHGKGQAATSVARKTTSLRQFFRHCCAEGWLTEDPSRDLPSPRGDRRIPDPLSEDEMNRLMAACEPGLDYDGPRADDLRARDRVLLLVLYAAGLRVSELCGLTLSQLELAGPWIRVRGKGRKERVVPLVPDVARALASYLEGPRLRLVDGANLPWVFPGPKGTALTRQAFWYLLRRLARTA